MLFGITITPVMLLAGGAGIFALLVFEILLGTRKIAFKGKRHLQVHKAVAYVMLVLGVLHALGALAHFSYI